MVDTELPDLTLEDTVEDQANPAEALPLPQLDPMDKPPTSVFLLHLSHHKEALKDLDHKALQANATAKPPTPAPPDLLEKRVFPDTMVWMDFLDWTVLMELTPKMPKPKLNNTKDASPVLKDPPDLLDLLEELDLEE